MEEKDVKPETEQNKKCLIPMSQQLQHLPP